MFPSVIATKKTLYVLIPTLFLSVYVMYGEFIKVWLKDAETHEDLRWKHSIHC